jgi:ABC-2 type transport system permease protein
MLLLIVYVFSLGIYVAATVLPDTLYHAPIAIVDEDTSPLSHRITDAFHPPEFLPPALISLSQSDYGLDTGAYTFVLDIPPNFQSDILAGRRPSLQLNVDATRMTQAATGSGYIQAMVAQEVSTFLRKGQPARPLPVSLEQRILFNPSLTQSWFASVVEMINDVTLLSIILTGAALIREREHGTIEHLLVMPIGPFEIITAKIWSMGLVVLIASTFSLIFMVQGVLGVPVAGSIPLFLVGSSLNILATTSMGIFLGTIARSMQQFGLLMILVLIPLEVLSGGMTPSESMPQILQWAMDLTPTKHFVSLAQAILFRGAGLDVVWADLLALLAIGSAFFVAAWLYFRKAITSMG